MNYRTGLLSDSVWVIIALRVVLYNSKTQQDTRPVSRFLLSMGFAHFVIRGCDYGISMLGIKRTLHKSKRKMFSTFPNGFD